MGEYAGGAAAAVAAAVAECKAVKVIVDLLFIVPGRNRGTQTYVDSLLPELRALPGLEVVCLTNRRNHRYYAEELGLECHLTPVGGGNRPLRILYQQLAMNKVARRLGGDALLCPGYLSPVTPQLPTVVILHDMNFRDIPETVSAGRRLIYNLVAPRAVRSAAGVITVSQFAKERMELALGEDGRRAVVVYGGGLTSNGATEGGADWAAVQGKYGIRGDCFLSISSGESYKNIRRLVEGFVAAQEHSPGGEQLVLVGHKLEGGVRSWLGRAGFGAAVVDTGFIAHNEKIAFLRNSLAYFFPSLYEGFGLPALEAQSCGLPLAASRYGSLPEVCGPGAVYFDAMSVESIADTFLQLRADGELRARLVREGYANLERFSWQRAAAETEEVLRAAVG